MEGRRLIFNVCTMFIGLGPFRIPVPLGQPQTITEVDPKCVGLLALCSLGPLGRPLRIYLSCAGQG